MLPGFLPPACNQGVGRIPKRSAVGVDGQTVEGAKETFREWIGPMLESIHRQGYKVPNIRRLYPQTRKDGEAPPWGANRIGPGFQRSTAEVLSAIYEQDFLPCSFGGRPGLGAHCALATLNEVIAGGMIVRLRASHEQAQEPNGCWRRI